MTPEQNRIDAVAALRSGKYQQGPGRLLTLGAHQTSCCLGVLAQECKVPYHHPYDTSGAEFDFGTGFKTTSFVPYSFLQSHFGIAPHQAKTFADDSVDANDHLKKTFDEIALMWEQWFSEWPVVTT